MSSQKCASPASPFRDCRAQNADRFSGLIGTDNSENPDLTQASAIFAYKVDPELRVIEVLRCGGAS